MWDECKDGQHSSLVLCNPVIQYVQLLSTVTLLFFLRYLLSTTALVASKACLFLLKSDKQTDVVCHD